MKPENFIHTFANLPLPQRSFEANVLYDKIHKLHNKMLPDRIKLEKLLNKAEKLFIELNQ